MKRYVQLFYWTSSWFTRHRQLLKSVWLLCIYCMMSETSIRTCTSGDTTWLNVELHKEFSLSKLSHSHSIQLMCLNQIFKEEYAKCTVYIRYPLLFLIFSSCLGMFEADSGQYQSGCPSLLECPADSFRAPSGVSVGPQRLREVSGTSC